MIPFDHTTFGQEGHYLYINVSLMQKDYLNNMYLLELQNGSILYIRLNQLFELEHLRKRKNQNQNPNRLRNSPTKDTQR